MKHIDKTIVKQLYHPPKDSHKGQNGKLTIIGGSKLFHGASLWALKVASRIVDMVYYRTVPDNKVLTQKLKSEIYDFICIPKSKVEEYIKQSDVVLIGPGLVRGDKDYTGTGESGEETKKLTKKLLLSFPHKKWIIDAGSLQVMDKKWLKQLTNVVITPHQKELENLFGVKVKSPAFASSFAKATEDKKATAGRQKSKVKTTFSVVKTMAQKLKVLAKKYDCIIVLKGKTDIICSPQECVYNTTGNEGMTKGGTGDVLAGLIAALSCKNDLFLAASAGVYINGLAGDRLYKKVGPYFNASDLCEEIPKVMRELLGY